MNNSFDRLINNDAYDQARRKNSAYPNIYGMDIDDNSQVDQYGYPVVQTTDRNKVEQDAD